MSFELHLGDCLEILPTLPENSVHLVLTDPPYGSTACKWDAVIPFEPMWEQLRRIAKPKAAIVLFGSEPFSSALRTSDLSIYRYDWYWDKVFGANFVQAKRMPLKTVECASVFSVGDGLPIYYPVLEKRDKPIKKGGNKPSEAIPIRQTETAKLFSEAAKTYEFKMPNSLLRHSCRDGRGYHPTQKPVELLRYLIRTYTNEGETVLDFTMGSGSTGVAALLENRKFVGIEKDEGYFNIAKSRIETAMNKLFV